MPRLKATYAIVAVFVLGAVGGCASVPPPTDAVSEAEQAIERAEQAQAREFAAFELAQAGRKLEHAKELSTSESNKDKTRARRLAKQATVDARLAEEQGHLGRAQRTYKELKEAVENGRSERTGNESPEGGTQ